MDDPENNWGNWFNNICSGLAALAGIAAIVVSSITSLQIKDLSQQQDSARLIGDLTDSLISKKIGRDVSLLALEHTLNPESGIDQTVRSRILLARIATVLIEGSLNEDSADFNNSVDHAALVLRRLITSSGDDCETFYSSYNSLDRLKGIRQTSQQAQGAATKATPEAGALLETCGPAGQLAMTTLSKAIQGTTTTGEQAISPSQLAHADKWDADAARSALVQSRINTKLSTLTIEQARQKNPNALPSLGVVTIHVDHAPESPSLQRLIGQLSKDRWFIVAGIRTVPATDRSCGSHSSVRFFRDSDLPLAKELVQSIARHQNEQRRDHSLQKLLEGEGNQRPGILLSNLSTWRHANHVPPATMELWLMQKGKACRPG